jgi:hypothetical protein
MESENHLVGNAGVFVRAARQAGQRSQPPSKVDRSVTPPGTTAAQPGTESELERSVHVSTPPLLDGTVRRSAAVPVSPCHATHRPVRGRNMRTPGTKNQCWAPIDSMPAMTCHALARPFATRR